MDIKELIKKYIPNVTEDGVKRFELYYEMLVSWNETRCNLTAITQPEEVVTKHFADSLLPEALIPKNALCIDVGTGAGFPGIPLLIMRPDIRLVTVDSLKKRVDFINALTEELGIEVRAIHARAEDAGRDVKLRESFDIALTRAVAQTNILLEWTTPFLKRGGKSLMYKGSAANDELRECGNALRVLNLRAELISFEAEWGERAVICAEKCGKTPEAYPRKAGTAKKKPL